MYVGMERVAKHITKQSFYTIQQFAIEEHFEHQALVLNYIFLYMVWNSYNLVHTLNYQLNMFIIPIIIYCAFGFIRNSCSATPI
jgi:hypothetical protein